MCKVFKVKTRSCIFYNINSAEFCTLNSVLFQFSLYNENEVGTCSFIPLISILK